MIQFTTGDNVVYDGQQCLVRGVDGNEVRLVTSRGDYITVGREFITDVYFD